MNPNILVYRNGGGREYASDEIFSTTIHELAHTTHWRVMNLGPVQFFQVSANIRESWAVGVEWRITSLEYRSRGIANYGTENYEISASYPLDRAYQYWTRNLNATYTPLFIDLLDNFNQSSGDSSLPNDPITGYTLLGIESTFLKHTYGLSSLSNNLKAHKPAGITDAQIDLFISNY